jgi:curli biogenesis system outer membrane secretion channel CsgG
LRRIIRRNRKIIAIKGRSFQEILLLLLTAILAAAVAPFAVFRLIDQQWATAILDFSIVVIMFGLFLHVYFTRETKVPGFVVALTFIAAALGSLHLQGIAQLYWLYYALTAAFFLLSATYAMLLGSVALQAIWVMLWGSVTPLALFSVSLTLLTNIFFAYSFALTAKRQTSALEQLATVDPLTGAGNRRAQNRKLDAMSAMFRRNHTAVSVLILDMDHFKKINDTHGHIIGDEILVELADLIRESIRPTDNLYRYGSEEFIVMTSRLLLTSLAACNATMPTMGGSEGNTVTGAAGGANAEGNNSGLESCDETMGTLSVLEDTNLDRWDVYRTRCPQLGSTIALIRTMIQQSNCFVVVERGRAMSAMSTERALMDSGELREGSKFQKGQMVAADFTMNPSIQFAAKGTGGLGAIAGGLFGSVGALVGGGLKSNEASTTQLLIDNRSGVQISASQGNAKSFDFDVFGGLFGGSGGGGAGAFSNTPEGKILAAAFADSFNHMVSSLRNYRAQTVKGGLGKGGTLKVGD